MSPSIAARSRSRASVSSPAPVACAVKSSPPSLARSVPLARRTAGSPRAPGGPGRSGGGARYTPLHARAREDLPDVDELLRDPRDAPGAVGGDVDEALGRSWGIASRIGVMDTPS